MPLKILYAIIFIILIPVVLISELIGYISKKRILKISLAIIAIPVVLFASFATYALVALGATTDEVFLPIKMLGSCTTGDECLTYCDSHIPDCFDFAVKFFPDEFVRDFPPDKRAGLKKLAEALRSGVKLPGGSTSMAEWNIYCNSPSNTEECSSFREAFFGLEQ